MTEQLHQVVKCRICGEPTEWKFEGCCPGCQPPANRPFSVEARAVQFIRRLVEYGDFIDSDRIRLYEIHADELLSEAKAILEEAKRCGNFKP